MKRDVLNTQGIVLARTNFGEADRIITVLTPDHGKLRLMAKGTRRVKSKLAGGIELFSVSEISFIAGKGDIGTLVSSRLITHYGKIVTDINRTMLGYELLKRLNKATEDSTDEEYFNLLKSALDALNGELNATLLELWFDAQLLKMSGHQPNLNTDITGTKLAPDQHYNLDIEAMTFTMAEPGAYQATHIKLLRLVFGLDDATQLNQLQDFDKVLPVVFRLVTSMYNQFT